MDYQFSVPFTAYSSFDEEGPFVMQPAFGTSSQYPVLFSQVHPSQGEKMPGCHISYLFISEHRFLLEIYHLKAGQEKENFTPNSPITSKWLLCDIQLWTCL